jgi:hypothetical protein
MLPNRFAITQEHASFLILSKLTNKREYFSQKPLHFLPRDGQLRDAKALR